MLEQLQKWRRDLHQIPELGLEENQTTEYLKNELIKMGYDPKPLPQLKTGCYVYLDYGFEKCVAFRTDIDALPICEANDIAFKSGHEGIMHACGHDGHMAAMLGFAYALKHDNIQPQVNILLIFEPAEEGPGGAKIIVESGLLKEMNVEAIFGIHLMPTIEEGVLATKKDGLMAECGEIDIHITGRDAHAGLPQNGIDSLLVAAHLLEGYQQILTRMKSPFDPAIINIGQIHGGTARNSVAKECEMHGTMRTYSEDVFNFLVKKMEDFNKGAEISYGCKIDFSCPPLYPPVLNDEKLVKFLSEIDDIVLLDEPLMLAEDFSFYQKAVPGVFVFVGTKCEKYQSGLHTDHFNFDEKVLKRAVDMYIKIACQYK